MMAYVYFCMNTLMCTVHSCYVGVYRTTAKNKGKENPHLLAKLLPEKSW